MGERGRREAILLLPSGLEKWVIREAYSLVESADYSIVDVIRYRRHPYKVISDYKVEEVVKAAQGLKGEAKVIVYDEIKPATFMRISSRTGLPVIDRVMLILEIFALNAGSREAKLQIELAEIKHKLPLVREMIRSAKRGELPGFLGPGGYAIDKYYAYLVSRASRVRRILEELRERRRRERARRIREGFLHAAIIGYASAGKTSIFNSLVGTSKPVGPKYFTTLSPKRRSITLGNKIDIRVVLIDTVGFISNIPPELIEAFNATLEEATSADFLLFVVDISEEEYVVKKKVREGIETLRRIGVIGTPLLLVLNKRDLSPGFRGENLYSYTRDLYPNTTGYVYTSAKHGTGLEEIKAWLENLAQLTGRSSY